MSDDADVEKLRAEAESLGVKIDQRWGAPRLQQEIDVALAAPRTAHEIDNGLPAPQTTVEMAPLREKTLHELNMEQWRSDRANYDLNAKAGEAAKVAVVQTLAEKRPDGKRTRKDLRPASE